MRRPLGSLGCIETSVGCDDCPYTSSPKELCKVLGLAMLRDNLMLRVTEQLNEIERLAEENASLENRVDKLGKDRLLQVYSPAGLVDLIEHDQQLQDELAGDDWGIIYMDVRFLKYYNEVKGRQAGDDYLVSVRDRVVQLAKRRFRQRTEPIEEDLRHENSPDRDVIWRAGGDEIGIVVRGVNAARLEIMRYRLANELSVTAGQAAIAAGKTPAVASVAACHATDVERQTDINESDVLQLMATLDMLALRADLSHGDEKKLQYDQMWHELRLTYNPLVRPFIRRPHEERTIAARFLSRFTRDAPSGYTDQ